MLKNSLVLGSTLFASAAFAQFGLTIGTCTLQDGTALKIQALNEIEGLVVLDEGSFLVHIESQEQGQQLLITPKMSGMPVPTFVLIQGQNLTTTYSVDGEPAGEMLCSASW